METKQNIFALRPLELKHFFEFAIRILRFNFVPLFLVMAIAELPISLMTLPLVISLIDVSNDLNQMSMTGDFPGEDFFLQYLDLGIWAAGLMIFSMAYQLLVLPLGNLTCCRLATKAIFGERLSILEAFEFAKKRYWPTQVALATFFLPLLVLSLLLLIPVLAFSMSGDETAIISSAVFALFVIGAGFLATILLFFRFFPALFGIIQCSEEPEGEGIFAQGLWYLKRSYQLSTGYFLRLLGLVVLAWIIIGFIRNGFNQSAQWIIEIIRLLMDGGLNPSGFLESAMSQETDKTAIGISMIVSMMLGLIFPPLLRCYYVLLYYDMRFRKEGLDLKFALGTEEPPQ